ncbi:MAG: sodium:solute symporter, partial [Flavobacteriaceae bacterium]|nr:sodium:solute symporter [Flavobacteriaceae bacterium]
AQAYLVNDIYLKYKNPQASNTQIKNMNYLTGIVVVVVSIILGLFAKDVNSVLQWIVSVLYGSYVGANILKWYWWRFNGEGFFWGMAAGLISAGIVPELFPDVLGLYLFPVILIISLIGSLIGTYSAPPTDEAVLKTFYKNVRPWGFWAPVNDLIVAEDPDFKKNTDFGRDMFNVTIGIIAQTVLVIIPMYVIFRQDVPLYIALAVLAVCLFLLKKYWWNTLNEKLN